MTTVTVHYIQQCILFNHGEQHYNCRSNVHTKKAKLWMFLTAFVQSIFEDENYKRQLEF